MVENSKTVRDPIHGDIKIKGFIVELLETPEVQRLYNIKQLGFAHLVFPGAHHTRLEHSLGTYKIASQIAEILNLSDTEKDIIISAALLHDIGHGPFSHTLESTLWEKFFVDHIELTERLILGEYDIFESDERKILQAQTVSQVLDKYNLDKKDIVNSIRGRIDNKLYLSQILNSTIDVDQLDYLIRDAYYTGVAYGMIDIDRLLQTLMIHDGNLAVMRKGVSVVENILVARGLMYSSVYFHKTVRIAELMLSKAIELLTDVEPFEFFRMTDGEIMNKLKTMGGFQREIVIRLKYRRLFKQAFAASFYDLGEAEMGVVKELEDGDVRREKERELEHVFGISKGHLIIDIPRPELLRAEPRIIKTDVCVFDRDELRSLDDFTPVAKAIRSRFTPDWIVMIITDERYREVVSRKAGEILFH